MSTDLFIRRPVLTTLLMAAIVLFGIMGFRLLPVSDLPNVDFPTIQVSAQLPGASPETMASAVATPLEKQFTTIAGIDSMTSSMPMPRVVRARGSSCTRTAYFCEPNTCTWATPAIVEMR